MRILILFAIVFCIQNAQGTFWLFDQKPSASVTKTFNELKIYIDRQLAQITGAVHVINNLDKKAVELEKFTKYYIDTFPQLMQNLQVVQNELRQKEERLKTIDLGYVHASDEFAKIDQEFDKIDKWMHDTDIFLKTFFEKVTELKNEQAVVRQEIVDVLQEKEDHVKEIDNLKSQYLILEKKQFETLAQVDADIDHITQEVGTLTDINKHALKLINTLRNELIATNEELESIKTNNLSEFNDFDWDFSRNDKCSDNVVESDYKHDYDVLKAEYDAVLAEKERLADANQKLHEVITKMNEIHRKV